jgi:hypothetical protein
MSTTHQGKSGGKPRQRSRKTHQPSRKPEQPQSPTPDPRNETQIGSVIASPEVSTDDTAAPVAVIAPLIGAVFPANKDPVSIQTIANAYRDYTRRSLQESEVLVEKLISARSFDKAIEIQNEFARQAYSTFVAEAQRICELHRELATQTFKPWEALRPR